MGNNLKNNYQKMKALAFGLLATTALGIELQGHHPDFWFPVDEITAWPGEVKMLYFEEDPTTGFEWNYDENIINGLFQVDTIYIPSSQCDDKTTDCHRTKAFQLTAGQNEGTAIFYTCKTRYENGIADGSVRYGVMDKRYDVMHNKKGPVCEEITLHVEKLNDLGTYELDSNLDVYEFNGEVAKNLKIGDGFKISVVDSVPGDSFYTIADDQDGKYLEIGSPEETMRSWKGEAGPIRKVYPVKVIGAGKGTITLVSYSHNRVQWSSYHHY